jgi:hypothetical protein
MEIFQYTKNIETGVYILWYIGTAKKTWPRFDPSNMGENMLTSLSLVLDHE